MALFVVGTAPHWACCGACLCFLLVDLSFGGGWVGAWMTGWVDTVPINTLGLKVLYDFLCTRNLLDDLLGSDWVGCNVAVAAVAVDCVH